MGILNWLRGIIIRKADDLAIGTGYSFFFEPVSSSRLVAERSKM